MKQKAIRVILLIGSLCLLAYFGPQIYIRQRAMARAEELFQKNEIHIQYDVPDQIESREAFARELIRLATWENEIKDQINYAFYHSDSEWDLRKMGYRIAPEASPWDEDSIYELARYDRWTVYRTQLDETVYSAVDDLYSCELALGSGMPSRENLLECYENNDLFGIKQLSRCDKEGDAGEIAVRGIYDQTPFSWGKGWKWIYMDIACILWPEKVCLVGGKYYLSKIDNIPAGNLGGLMTRLEEYMGIEDTMQERYGLALYGREDLQDHYEQLQQYQEMRCPERYMPLEGAFFTKLGKPGFVTQDEHKDENGQTYYTGELYWYVKGYVEFYATFNRDHISDTMDFIGDPAKLDDRKCPYAYLSDRESSSSHYYDSSDEIDPDDYNLEGYFEDHRDLYDDMDDAYDGFLDDMDAWDDY